MIAVWRLFWSATLDFITYTLTVVRVKYPMWYIRPETSDNASKWIIPDDYWANNWNFKDLAAILDAILKIIHFA